MRCMEHYVKGKCYTKDCKRGHPTICRNIENEGICRNSNRCQYLHPDNYYRQDRRFRNNNRKGNNNNMSNNNDNNNNNINDNMSVNHGGYRGHEEWNRGNSTKRNNRNNNGYMKYGDSNRWEQGYERDVNFHGERDYCEQWPTPWEGRIENVGDENRQNRQKDKREYETEEVVDGREEMRNGNTNMGNCDERNKDKRGNERGPAWKIIYQNIRGLVTNSSRE